jgi:hypothetical protein
MQKFILWVLPGQIIKMLFIAYAGSLSLEWIFK